MIVPAPSVAGGEAATPDKKRRTNSPPIFCTRATPIWRIMNTAMKGIYSLFRPYSSDNGAANKGPVALISVDHGMDITEADEIQRDGKNTDLNAYAKVLGNILKTRGDDRCPEIGCQNR